MIAVPLQCFLIVDYYLSIYLSIYLYNLRRAGEDVSKVRAGSVMVKLKNEK
jgi:hypothetical protein